MATAGAEGEGSASGNFAFKLTCKFVFFPSLFNYSSIKHDLSCLATYARVVKTGVPRAHGGRSNRALIQILSFLLREQLDWGG
jgi:hypothetical protein